MPDSLLGGCCCCRWWFKVIIIIYRKKCASRNFPHQSEIYKRVVVHLKGFIQSLVRYSILLLAEPQRSTLASRTPLLSSCIRLPGTASSLRSSSSSRSASSHLLITFTNFSAHIDKHQTCKEKKNSTLSLQLDHTNNNSITNIPKTR